MSTHLFYDIFKENVTQTVDISLIPVKTAMKRLQISIKKQSHFTFMSTVSVQPTIIAYKHRRSNIKEAISIDSQQKTV